MDMTQVERRSLQEHGAQTTKIIKQGLMVQRQMGTVSAIEYLKAYAIDGATIQRVLGGSTIRREDKMPS